MTSILKSFGEYPTTTTENTTSQRSGLHDKPRLIEIISKSKFDFILLWN